MLCAHQQLPHSVYSGIKIKKETPKFLISNCTLQDSSPSRQIFSKSQFIGSLLCHQFVQNRFFVLNFVISHQYVGHKSVEVWARSLCLWIFREYKWSLNCVLCTVSLLSEAFSLHDPRRQHLWMLPEVSTQQVLDCHQHFQDSHLQSPSFINQRQQSSNGFYGVTKTCKLIMAFYLDNLLL